MIYCNIHLTIIYKRRSVMNDVKEKSNLVGTTAESTNGILKQIIDKMDGEQITRITISAFKYGTICFVAYICRTEGIKALFGNLDTDDESTAA